MKKRNRLHSSTTSSVTTVSSHLKGVAFEDDVANLYRLLGAEVVQNIEIDHKKVDILAIFTIPGSTNKHRILVECKDEQKKVADNQRVMQFVGLLSSARKLGLAESAEIITRVPWSDMAKGFARENGIDLLTYKEKLAQLIDFRQYLNSLIEKFDKGDPSRSSDPALGAFYVVPQAEQASRTGAKFIKDMDDYLVDWVKNEKTKSLAILGEYGTGKTSVCQKLARDLASYYLNSTIARIPILLNLREFTKKLEIEALVTSFLDKECEVINPRYRLFDAMNKAGMFLLIFDAFDEMAVRVDRDTLEINLQEIEKLAGHQQSKAIITSRIEYFVTVEEEVKAFQPKGDIIETRRIQYDTLVIKTWDDAQVNAFLSKRVPLVTGATRPWSYYRDQIKAVPELTDLSKRPVLLDMIAKTLPQLINSGKRINRQNLYQTYLIGELQRQKILKKRELLLSSKARFSLLETLALEFLQDHKSAITFSDAANLVLEKLSPPVAELESYTRDFLSCSFLIRKGDEYRFSHNSIMEYLCARSLMAEIKNFRPDAIGRYSLPPVVAGFLADMKPDKRTLLGWLESINKDDASSRFLRGNAATLLCLLDGNAFDGKVLRGKIIGADLRLADLRNSKLDKATLHSVNLTGAKFFEKEVSLCELENVVISITALGELKKSIAKDHIHNEVSLLARNLCKIEGVKNFAPVAFKIDEESVLMRLDVQVSSSKAIKRIESYLASIIWIKEVAIYYEEYERLITKLPVKLSDVLDKLLATTDVWLMHDNDFIVENVT